MEKFNLNEGNEALNRVLLMMKYDANKTLTENVEKIEEQNRGKVALGSAAAGAAVGSVSALGTVLGLSAAASGALIGGAAALSVAPLAYWLITKDDGKGRVEKIFKYCSTDKSKISKIQRGVDDKTIRDLSDKIYDSIEGVGTDEDAIYSALGQLKTASDFCALINRYTQDNGDLFDDLDSDIDDQSEWDKIYRPIRNCVEDTLLKIKDDTIRDCKTNPNQPKCKGGDNGGGKKVAPPISKYHRCVGTYTQGCISDAITQVQGCLSLVTDGKFGPKTQAALASKGFPNGFKDSDVPKICSSSTVPGQTPQDKLNQDYGVTPQPNAQAEVQTTNDDINNY